MKETTPVCPLCNGTRLVDKDTGHSVDAGYVYAVGGYINAIDYECVDEECEEELEEGDRT